MAFDATTRFVAMISGTQAGKRLPVDTEIPTPNGFIAIGDLNVGDVVFDERGIRCRVIAVTNHVVPEQCYRITFDDGVSIVADAEHQWLIQTAKQRKNQARRIINPNQLTLDTQGWPVADYTIVTTRDLLKNTILFQGKKWRSNYSIDMPMPVQYSERDLPIPPYTLGAWLGDGSRNSAGFYCADNEIIESIKSEGYPISPPKIVANQGKARTYKLGQSEWYIKSGHKSKFTSACKELGILGNKRIPKKYLTSSVGQRLALLGGLLDTDGYCCKNSQCQFYTIKQDLANDVLELTRSLGIKARLKSKTATCNGKDCGLVWTVSFTTDMPVFTVKRKLNRQMNRDKQRDDTTRRFVLKVEPVDSVDCRCIMVDSPNRLYLATRDYIVTHNTSWAPWWLLNEIRRRGRGDYGAVTASYDLFKLKLLPAIQNVFCNITGIGKYWAGDRIIEIRENASPDGRFLANRSDDVMWARIILRSAEAEGGLESGTLKAVILDEAGQPSFGRMAWSAVKRRLAIHSGRALVTSTLYNLGWLKQDFIDPFDGKLPKVMKAFDNGAELRMYQNDLITLIQFDSIANPSFPMEDFELARATMPPDEFEMFWRGRAAKLRTLIYDCYEPKLHDVNDFEIPHHWPRFVGIDPLGAHIAALWIAYDPENEKLYAYREYIAPFGDTTEKHVKNILDLSAGERILAWAGGGPSERQARLDWMNYGIDLQSPTEDPALKMDVWSQIMRVYSTFRHNDMFIFKSLGNLKAELGSYQRHKDKATGEMTDRILNKEIYDGLDSLRYLICYLTDPVEQREVVYMPSIINPHMRGY